MRFISLALGSLLLFVGASGLLMVALGPRDTIQVEITRALLHAQSLASGPREPGAREPALIEDPVAETAALGEVEAEAGAESLAAVPISHVRAPSIKLDSDVVPARVLRVGQARTWEVPAFSAGHAERTAGLGAPGNSVLLGHVSSLDAGNVFKDLGKLKPGDTIELSGGGQSLTYRVTAVDRVARTETSVLEATEDATATLITCTGTWLPALHDYSHRLAVRATLES